MGGGAPYKSLLGDQAPGICAPVECILHEISKRNANLIHHILRRNGFLQQIIEGKIKGGIEVTRRRGRRRRKLLDELKERSG